MLWQYSLKGTDFRHVSRHHLARTTTELNDRLPDDQAELASQPTLSRFENFVSVKALFRLRELLVDQLIESFDKESGRLTFDLDGFDDPAHGAQQLTLFHGDDQQNQYFPLIVTNAETDLMVMVALRHGTAHAALPDAESPERPTGAELRRAQGAALGRVAMLARVSTS